MGKQRILILGAGLTGLSAAWHLQKNGLDCAVFEKENQVGGLCRSIKVKDFIFDCDGHLLHFKQRYAFNLVKKLLGVSLVRHQRRAFVYSHNRYIPYPFQANLYRLPAAVIGECLNGMFSAAKSGGQSENKKDRNFLAWMNRVFGPGVSRHFMIPYNTKFWTLPPEELTCEWLDGFIPVPSLKDAILGSKGRNRKRFGYNACFWYPQNSGIAALPLAFAKQISNIYTDSRVTSIDLANKEIGLASGEKHKFDCLISTLPLPELPALVKGMPAALSRKFKQLKWTSIFNLNLGLEKKDGSRRHWVYFPQEDISFFRVGFFHNFSARLAPAGRGSLYIEVSYSAQKPLDKKSIVLSIKRDLANAGILGSGKIVAEQINDIKYGYPVYDANYRSATGAILAFLSKNRIISCGRYGAWRYMSMEDSIMQAKQVAEAFSAK